MPSRAQLDCAQATECEDLSMEARLYFVLGDCLGNALVGAFSGWAAVAWMPHALGFWLGMVVSMAGAMAVTMLLALTLLLRWLGTHEVMVPTMIGGMTANMTVCALAHHHAMSPLDGAWLGALIGLGVLLLTYIANARMTREA
jgi:hypothetical protein